MEVKYRAWDKTHKVMNYKVLVGNTDYEDENYTCNSIWIDYGKRGSIGWVNADDKCIELMQYIGIKNKNGKEIYEGDILYYAERNQWFKVFRVGGGFSVNTHQDDLNKSKIIFYTGLSDMQTASWISNLEIKGNIYNNPELLNMASTDYDITKEE